MSILAIKISSTFLLAQTISRNGAGTAPGVRAAHCVLHVPCYCYWLFAALLGRISWLRRVRLENPLGHGNFLSGLKLSGERDGGLGLARFSAVCPLGGHMYANGL
jgi:hypothetical protein